MASGNLPYADCGPLAPVDGDKTYVLTQEGAEVIVEKDHLPVAVIRTPLAKGRLSECIALAEAHEKEAGEAPVLDPDFAADVEEIDRNRKPWNPPTWD